MATFMEKGKEEEEERMLWIALVYICTCLLRTDKSQNAKKGGRSRKKKDEGEEGGRRRQKRQKEEEGSRRRSKE